MTRDSIVVVYLTALCNYVYYGVACILGLEPASSIMNSILCPFCHPFVSTHDKAPFLEVY